MVALVEKLEASSPPSNLKQSDEPLWGEASPDLVRLVELSREMRTLGVWLVEQEEYVKNKPWQP